jgi:hypothetical protein
MYDFKTARLAALYLIRIPPMRFVRHSCHFIQMKFRSPVARWLIAGHVGFISDASIAFGL